MENEITLIEVSKIKRNEHQPRKYFNEESIKELSESIKKDGLMQPITVREVSRDTFEIVQGERRFRAAKLAGLTEISAFVREMDDEEAFHLAVIENIQREDMTPIEEAQAFQKYIELGYTHAEIAEKVSKGRTYVSQRLRLLNLSTEIQDMIALGKMSEGHAKQLFKYENILSNHIRRDDPNKVVQDLFYNYFQDHKKISVKDVKDWGELMRYHFIAAIVGTFNGKGNLNLWNEYRSIKSFCGDYNLHINTITKQDIDFLCEWSINNAEEGAKKSEIYKMYEDLEERLFSGKFDVDDIWNKRDVHYLQEQTINELADLIKNKLTIMEEAKDSVVSSYREAARNSEGEQRDMLNKEADRIDELDALDYTAEMMDKDIEKVSRDTY